MYKKLFLLTVFFLTLFLPRFLFAQEFNLNELKIEKVNPDSQFAYNTKRLKEKINLLFKFSSKSKINYYRDLLDIRLSEFKYIVDSKNVGHIEKASQRYETTAGELTEFILKKNVLEEIDSTKKIFESHRIILNEIKNNLSYDSLEWRLLMNDLNSLDIYQKKLSEF